MSGELLTFQSQLDGVVRNKAMYEKIVAALRDVSYERTWQQYKTKIKNIVQSRDGSRGGGLSKLPKVNNLLLQ